MIAVLLLLAVVGVVIVAGNLATLFVLCVQQHRTEATTEADQ